MFTIKASSIAPTMYIQPFSQPSALAGTAMRPPNT